MAIGDEKAEVDRTSNSVKEQDADNAMAGYLPRSDEEYNVTLKTWLVVTVSSSRFAHHIVQALTMSLDPVSIVRHQFLDRTVAQCMWCSRRDSAWRTYRSGVVCFALHDHRYHCLYGLWSEQRLVWSSVVHRWRQCYHVCWVHRGWFCQEQYFDVCSNVADWLCKS